jgi:predicted nucleic acid-binding protein
MSGSAVLDTNAVIDILNGRADRGLLRAETSGKNQIVSVITRMELLSFPGITSDEEGRITAFLSGRGIAPIDGEIEKTAIMFRRSMNSRLPDAIIAATAVCLGATLITHDRDLLNAAFPDLTAVSVRT